MINRIKKLNKSNNFENYKSYFPFIYLLFVLFIYHILISINFGDEVDSFGKILQNTSNYFVTIKNTLINMYNTWSSRVIFIFVIIHLAYLPSFIWKILDIAVILLAVKSLISIFNFKNKKIGDWIICILFLQYPFIQQSSAGWIATTTNYLWPLSFGIYFSSNIIKICQGKSIAKYHYICSILALIYVANQEQMSIVTLIVIIGAIIYSILKKNVKKINFLFLAINIAELIFILTCPGNYSRRLSECQTWMPDFFMMNTIDKFNIGFTHTINHFFQTPPILAIILFLLIFIVIYKKYNDFLFSSLAIIPFIVCMGHSVVGATYKQLEIFFKEVLVVNADTRMSKLNYLSIFVIIFALVISLCMITFLFDTILDKVIIIVILLSGIATSIVLGFSPTVYASGERTFTFMYFSILITIIMILKRNEDIMINYIIKYKNYIFIISLLSVINDILGIIYLRYYKIINSLLLHI